LKKYFWFVGALIFKKIKAIAGIIPSSFTWQACGTSDASFIPTKTSNNNPRLQEIKIIPAY
jgi:hypothetical protein